MELLARLGAWAPLVILVFVALGAWVIISILYRSVVATNMVHIVQSRKRTTSYGTGQQGSNVYYKWPRWLPMYGVTVIELPVSNFDLALKSYEAYDKDRVPFVVDVVAFFRIQDTGTAAQRVASIVELEAQLTQIVQGAVRKVLASANIDMIMLERAQFGNQFTDEVREQLKQWGVEPVKSMELMDIRDGHGSQVIANIMAKKTSHIEMESRTEVAGNMKTAETAEIEARQIVEIRRQEAAQAVGQRTAEKEKAVGIATQEAEQAILVQVKQTRERDMEVKRVNDIRTAEIKKDEQIVAAEQDKRTRILIAEGHLEAKKNEATGIQVEGAARADAERLLQLAPVMAQIELAKEIGANPGYQQYLATIEAVKAHIAVGSKQAEALQVADIKVIANAGRATEGMSHAMDLFSSKGGTELAAMVEAFAQSPLVKTVLEQKLANAKENPASSSAVAIKPKVEPPPATPAS